MSGAHAKTVCRLRRQGVDLGSATLDEVRRRRQAGELTGTEYIQVAGSSDWQPVDWVLRRGVVSPLASVAKNPSRSLPPVFWGGLAAAILVAVGMGILIVKEVRKNVADELHVPWRSLADAKAAAKKPVRWTTNTVTAEFADRRMETFLTRQWLDAYRERGRRDSDLDADSVRLIESKIGAESDSPGSGSGLKNPYRFASRLAGEPGDRDPLVLAIASQYSVDASSRLKLAEKAAAAFQHSDYRAFPKFCADVWLASLLPEKSDRTPVIDDEAVDYFSKSFTDGSLTPEDQPELAEILTRGWGYGFARRNRHALSTAPVGAGSDYRWLRLILEGEREITDAWNARSKTPGGGGFAEIGPTYDFMAHLRLARKSLIEAWRLNSNSPIAATRMITVALGDGGIADMRVWFDRAVAAEFDYPRAWSDFRWGLQPAAYGDTSCMLDFGSTALATGRFDTKVPEEMFEAVKGVESQMKLTLGRHIYGSSNVWPSLSKMYLGYIAVAENARSSNSWRSSYALAAYFGRKYDVAKDQLERVDWKLSGQLSGWGADLTLVSLEVAARTSGRSNEVARAEAARDEGKIDDAIAEYTAIDPAAFGPRASEFVSRRLAGLRVEQRLSAGDWVDFLPKGTNDPGWLFPFGKIKSPEAGGMEIGSFAGAGLGYALARTGLDFELTGEFVPVDSGASNIQAGIVFGIHDYTSGDWYEFRMSQASDGAGTASLGHGWSQRKVSAPAELLSGANTFELRFQHGRATATINGKEVFRDAKPLSPIRALPNQAMIGIGLVHGMPAGAVQYKNVRLRRLSKPNAKPGQNGLIEAKEDAP